MLPRGVEVCVFLQRPHGLSSLKYRRRRPARREKMREGRYEVLTKRQVRANQSSSLIRRAAEPDVYSSSS